MASQLACPILSSTLVFLLILFTATHAQCPAGCTCNFEHGTVECRGMVTLTTNMFPSNTSSIKFIQLYAIEIPADMFSSYPNLKMIDIFQCNFAGGGIRRNAFRNLQNLDYIRIRTSRITTIEDGVFNNLRNVSEISLFGVTTDTVTSRMFDGIDGVKLFKISRCMFRYVKERAFTNIQNVGEFIFEQNSRDLHVSKNAFSDFGNIGRMQICPTKFQSVNARSFSNLTGIARFEFCKNRLGQVPGETFWNIDANLIIFQRNQFNDLQSGTIDSLVAANPNAVHMIDNTFRCNCSVNWMLTDKRDMMLPYLKTSTCFDRSGPVTLADITIGNCGVLTTTTTTTVTTTTLATTPTTSLTTQCPTGCTCNFEHGTVECRGTVTLTTNMFPSTTSSIKFIHLYAIEIPADMFSSYPNLKMIDIFQCNFAGGGIRRNAFRNLQNLDYIRIRTSRIATIEDGVFNNLRNVSEITLFGVTTDTVTSRMFDGIDGVKLFKISRCMFRYVKERAFTNIQNVGEFIFEQNSRDLHVSKNAFSDFGNIGRMQICPTKFQSVNARSFSNLTGIAIFEFCKNRLGQVPGETFWNIDANLIIFQRNQFNDLHSGTIDSLVAANPNAVHMIDNTFRCNCSVNWMITKKRDMMLPYLRNGTCFDKPGEVTLAEIGNCGELTTTSSTTAPTTTMSTTTMPTTTASTTSSAVITMAATTTRTPAIMTTQNSSPLTFSVLIPILAASSVSVALLTV